MVALVWALIQAILSLGWLVIEFALGWHDVGIIHAQEVLWLYIPPVCTVGAMVHDRMRTQGAVGYLQAIKTGVLATLLATTLTLLVWFVYISFLEPGFLELHEVSTAMRAKAEKMHPRQAQAALTAARLIFSVPNFYIVSALVPTLVGLVASLIAAFGIRRRP